MFQPVLRAVRLGPLALGIAILLSGPPRAAASTIVVPDQAPTIQAALDARVDTVLVRPGTYPESLFVLKTVVVQGVADGSDDRPSIMALKIRPDETGPPFTFRRLEIKGTVLLDSGGWSEYVFSDCDLQGSLKDNLKNYDITFFRCRVTGSLVLWTDGMEVDSCEVTGSVGLSKDSYLGVRGCTILGGGVLCQDNTSIVEGNTIRGGGFGVWCHGGGATIANNLIEDCQGNGGIAVDSFGDATISNNVIRRCAVGISVGDASRVSIVGNTIERARFSGLALGEADEADVIGNTFWMCGGDGMRVGSWYRYHLAARNNTSSYNGLSGFVSEPYDYPEAQEWTGNVGSGNGQYGFQWLRPGAGTFGCNDWCGNVVGQVQGRPSSGTEFSVDPQFCDGPGGNLHLNAASPLLAWPGCGQIGALGVGCGATPTLVQRFAAGRVSAGVRVVWQVAPGATASEIWVERADGESGQAWTRPTMESSNDGGSVVDLDRSALPDHAYRYRLVAMDGGRLLVLDPGVVVEAQARLSFALGQVGPSPSAGPLRIAFTLAHEAEIEVAVLDLLGRRVAIPAQGAWPAGTQVVSWNGAAPAGLYVVRYAFPGGTDKRVIVRVK